jgi:pyridoxamine 5'-phosphate oxidase
MSLMDAHLDDISAADDPREIARGWLDEARAAAVPMPEAMALATVGAQGTPAVRFVLCRGMDDQGVVFYTNYGSAKASDLEATGRAAVAFHWEPLQRQLRITGAIERTTLAQSEAYFAGRGRGSQLAAWASPQSRAVSDRNELDQRWAEAEARFEKDSVVPLPEHWGGYRISWESIEFWQGQPHRLHDRIRWTRADGGWAWERLAP